MPSKFQKTNVSFTSSIKNSIKKIQDDTRKKKADRYGITLADYDKGVKDAKAKGNKIAYNSFLKDVEKKQYLIEPSKVKKAGSTLSNINQILDSFEPKKVRHSSPKNKKKNSPIKQGTKYDLKGGRAKTKTTNKSKKRKAKKQNDWLGDLGFKF